MVRTNTGEFPRATVDHAWLSLNSPTRGKQLGTLSPLSALEPHFVYVSNTHGHLKLRFGSLSKTGTHLPLLETNQLKASSGKLKENTKYNVPFFSLCAVEYKTKQNEWESFWSQQQCSSWHPRAKGLVQGLGIWLWDTTAVRMAEHRKSSKICEMCCCMGKNGRQQTTVPFQWRAEASVF